jgi:hypothetical protein
MWHGAGGPYIGVWQKRNCCALVTHGSVLALRLKTRPGNPGAAFLNRAQKWRIHSAVSRVQRAWRESAQQELTSCIWRDCVVSFPRSQLGLTYILDRGRSPPQARSGSSGQCINCGRADRWGIPPELLRNSRPVDHETLAMEFECEAQASSGDWIVPSALTDLDGRSSETVHIWIVQRHSCLLPVALQGGIAIEFIAGSSICRSCGRHDHQVRKRKATCVDNVAMPRRLDESRPL